MPSTASFWTIINAVYDSSSAALRLNLSYDHTHSSGSGSGGQLDWDVVWSDAVHDHSTATEGGQLDWDVVWTDAVHNHSASAEGGVLDHGQALSSASLADDDHPQYVQENILTTNGDIPYATGSATWTRFGIGSANSLFSVNSGGTGYAWIVTPTATTVGSYTGGTGVNTAIAHGLGKVPTHVVITSWGANGTAQAVVYQAGGSSILAFSENGVTGAYWSFPALTSSSFFVGTSASYNRSMQAIGVTYAWSAVG